MPSDAKSRGVPQRLTSTLNVSSRPSGAASAGMLGMWLGDAVLHGSDFLAHGSGLVGTAVLHEGADLLGGAVALGLKSLDLLDHLAALLVERQEALLVPRAVALGHGGVEDLGVLTKQANVVHVVPPVVWRPLAGLQRLCPLPPKQARRSDESHNSVILALRAA